MRRLVVLTVWLCVPSVAAWAWQSGEHFTVTYDACKATTVVRPTDPARPWAKIRAAAIGGITTEKYSIDGEPSNWNENFCIAVASASADADVDAFDDDLAHTQTKYVGGVNFIGRPIGVTQSNTNHADFDQDPRRLNNKDKQTARLPPPVQRTAPVDMVGEWLDYFRRWSVRATADFRDDTPYEKTVKDGMTNYWGTPIISVWYIRASLGHDDPNNPVYALGRILHQIQDSCTHQGITGYQHAWAAYEVETNPDTDAATIATRRTNCTRPLTRAFFDALAAYIASWHDERLVHLRLSGWAVNGVPLRRPSHSANATVGRIGLTIVSDKTPWRQNIDYLYQLCDMPCRDFAGPGPAIRCTNSKLHARFLKDMWLAAIGTPAGGTMFTRSNWTTFIDQQKALHTNAQWLGPTDTTWDQPALGSSWWFIREGEMWLGDAMAPKGAKGLTLGCPAYGNRTAPFQRAKFTAPDGTVDPGQRKCNPNYEASFTAAPVNPAIECRKWRNPAVTAAGAQNVIQTNAAPFRDQAGVHTLNYDYNCRYYETEINHATKNCKNTGVDDPNWSP